jgi:hypothetical protein
MIIGGLDVGLGKGSRLMVIVVFGVDKTSIREVCC